MSKVICTDVSDLPIILDPQTYYFTLFSNSGNRQVGTIAFKLLESFARLGIAPTIVTFDFLRIALSINTADLVCEREYSPDGWTRTIELEISLCDSAVWVSQVKSFERMLRFLTGDLWHLTFKSGGELPVFRKPSLAMLVPYEEATCVSLLSGGMDSLIGGIDLVERGHKPIFMSQLAKGDRQKQILFAKSLKSYARHLQWNHTARLRSRAERSTRARSIIFYAFALVASELIQTDDKSTIYVPENGFISLNIPLDLGRLGSLSTKTTHPTFIKQLEEIWDSVGLKTQLLNPYQLKTKGEMVKECLNPKLLEQLISQSTSCGRYLTYGYKHCGRCVPCMVRRAAFKEGKVTDKTYYKFTNLKKSGLEKDANDINAVALACLMLQRKGAGYFAGTLPSADGELYVDYIGVVERGLNELTLLLQQHRVLV